MAFVLDASAALPWCFVDEATPATDRLRERAVAGETLHVPAHWPTEILNSVTRASRRGRIDAPGIDLFLRSILTLDVVIDAASPAVLWDETWPLVRAYRLSGYDAAYLALAKRLGLKLATLDAQLSKAALAEDCLWST